MGAWGVKALESDNGLDVLHFLNDYLAEHTSITLEDMVAVMKDEGLLGETFEDVDFLYDNTAMALAELYAEWLDTGKFAHGEENSVWTKVTDFTASQEALDFLLRYLHDIRNEVPDEDDEREIVELWKESDSWEEWSNHLDTLVLRLEQEKKK